MKIPVKVPAGTTLYRVLRERGLLASAYCGGRGICGRCVVRIEGKEELACRVEGPFDGWVELEREEVVFEGEELPSIDPAGIEGLGIAIDVGTTAIDAGIYDLSTGKCIKSLKVLNLQSAFGADVVSRIRSAEENYREERDLLLESILRVFEPVKGNVKKVVVVSNAVMYHFLLGVSVSGFERYPFQPSVKEIVEVEGGEIGLYPLKDVPFLILPPLWGFVGSDFASGIFYLSAKGEKNFGIADIGTNAEMGIAGDAVVTASAPAGPAIEGVGLFSGMRAIKGAIYRVFFDGRAFKFLTIGDVPPKGICATGYFDLIYLLRMMRLVNEEGTFVSGKGFFKDGKLVLYEDREVIVAVTQEDVRKFLLAKAGIYGGLKVLGERSFYPRKLFFSGALGTHLSGRSVRGVRLIPPEFPEPVPAGNTALKGAVFLLGGSLKDYKAVADRIKGVELAGNKDFEESYIEGLLL